MENLFTIEKNVQMLIYLMKTHGVSKVIVSPGTTNVTFVASIQKDSYFKLFSAPDERSAAYMACGLAAEANEPVALTCTGATASRNYVPGLTEAYYRKLPILAITGAQHRGKTGQLEAQVLDRSVIQNDIAVKSVHVPAINNDDDEWECNLKLNSALLALRYRGGGPVHINLETRFTRDFSAKKIPSFRVIKRVERSGEFPFIENERVGIFVGAHIVWSKELTNAVDTFCEKYNGVVFCDPTSNYQGKYGIPFSLVANQKKYSSKLKRMKLLIDFGEISGAYMKLLPEEVWRISTDGEIRDRWKKLTRIFDMEDLTFFCHYNSVKPDSVVHINYYEQCKAEYDMILSQIPELPFSNNWIAQHTCSKLPSDIVLHLGILNSLRSWGFFRMTDNVLCFSNTGGFGIDGVVSTLIGSSLANPEKLHLCVVGDLAFFYDLNSMGNRHVGKNVRIMLINNGCGTEFKNYSHMAAQFGDDANAYIAAMGHYGRQSRDLVQHYAQDLGYEYHSAASKEEYVSNVDKFLSPTLTDKPMIFEVFTDHQDESEALRLLNHAVTDDSVSGTIKGLAKSMLGDDTLEKFKKFVKR